MPKGFQLNGYPLPALPAELPPRIGKPPSGVAATEALIENIYPIDPVFRDRINSIDAATSESGSYIGDKILAAERIMAQAEKEGEAVLTDLGNRGLAKIARKWLPQALAKRGLSRQGRIRAAVEQGKLTATTTESGDPAQ